jgi:hypothetical protein
MLWSISIDHGEPRLGAALAERQFLQVGNHFEPCWADRFDLPAVRECGVLVESHLSSTLMLVRSVLEDWVVFVAGGDDVGQ